MRLVSIYDVDEAERLLYELLTERPAETWISHQRLPTFREHQAFVASHPFLHWFLIQVQAAYVGAIEVTDRNELGIAVLKRFQGHGYGERALSLFLMEHDPLPAIPAIRNGNWLANIGVDNADSKAFFRKMGFRPIQETWRRLND